MMKKTLSFITSFILPFLIVGCHSTHPAIGVPGGSEMLYRYQWNLTELQGQPVFQATGQTAYLLFSPGKVNSVSGNTGCNNLKGTFELTGVNFLKFSPLATTRIACPGNNKEVQFLEAIGQANNWSIINNQLLLNNGRILVAKFNGALPSVKPPVMDESSKLNGKWELNYISGPRISFNGLYPDKKPYISFDFAKNELNGNTSCNGFTSKITLKGNIINIAEPKKTKMLCEGGGETAFIEMLKKVNTYSVSADGNTLNFIMGDIAVMRFIKK